MTRILFHADALAEFEDAVAYYNRLTPGVGDELTTAILEGLDVAAASPLTCPQVTVKARKNLIRRFPYVIIFIHRDNVLVVVAVMHTSRKPGYWLSRLQEGK